jgi:hypothetical protein
MTDIWQQRALYLAGAWNIIGGAGALADPAGHFAQFYTTSLALEDPLGVLLRRPDQRDAWGIGYTMAGRHADARYRCSRPVARASSRTAGRAWVSPSRRRHRWLLATGIADVLFAALSRTSCYSIEERRTKNEER